MWDLVVDHSEDTIVSCGDDSSVKIWSLGTLRALLRGENHKEYTLSGMVSSGKGVSISNIVYVCMYVHTCIWT